MGVSFRAATPSDIPALHALVESGYRGDSAKQGWTHEADLLGGQRTDQAALAEMIADPAQTILLAERDGALIGCVLIADKGGGVGYMGLLTVSPSLQAGGVGRALIGAAEAHARDALGAHTMELTVIKQRRELVEWYLRRGYALTGREEPFPLDDPRFGLPKTRDLVFVVLARAI
ncbi:MAG: GNAT family N-acetyltransferase [Hyphomonadaceae bacterium]|nr:GNAT family N-acetyltransferase [Hyphomonadaceae bacterium]MBX3510878.1 GNAT family N-acetyltransferase [Hyphomonadaceae bacterium]